MSALPDPQVLLATADRIDLHAARARARAASLSTHVAHTAWTGRAADRAHELCTQVTGGLRTSAGRLEQAADRLRTHALAVRRSLDELARLAVTVDAAVTTTAGVLTHATATSGVVGTSP